MVFAYEFDCDLGDSARSLCLFVWLLAISWNKNLLAPIKRKITNDIKPEMFFLTWNPWNSEMVTLEAFVSMEKQSPSQNSNRNRREGMSFKQELRLLRFWWKKFCITWDGGEILRINGINYQPQLVQEFLQQQWVTILMLNVYNLYHINEMMQLACCLICVGYSVSIKMPFIEPPQRTPLSKANIDAHTNDVFLFKMYLLWSIAIFNTFQ